MSSDDTMSENLLDELFGVPSLPPSRLSPQRLPGSDAESLAALQHVLKENHRRHHIFFNDKRHHNHITHRALVIYTLGGSASIIRDYYERDCDIQRPAIVSPKVITEGNFVDHLGDDLYFQAYISFFSKQISEKGAANTIEEFIFSEKYNFQEGRDANTQPEMLLRFHSGLMHSFIHVGYGVEFGLKGMLVEGLAQVAIHGVRVRETYPPSIFTFGLTNGVSNTTFNFSSLALEASVSAITPVVSKIGGVHAFDIVARMLQDDRFDIRMKFTDYRDQVRHNEILAKFTPILKEHAEKWTIDLNQPGEVERKMEELVWLTSLLYGVGGLTTNGFISEFYLMHLVTSSIFLPSIFAYLSRRSQVILLRAYFFAVISLWVMRGRPALNIEAFMTTTSTRPPVTTTPESMVPLITETTPTPNPFLPILQSAIAHPNNHMGKIQRTFAHYDTLYGTRPVGYFKGTELEGAELLDGSLFLRSALLTAEYVGWVREGGEPRLFSQEGLFESKK